MACARSAKPDCAILSASPRFNKNRPWLEKMGLGKLQGDFHFKLFGREWFIPLTSTLLLSFIITLIAKFL
jgi:hypothetical protein